MRERERERERVAKYFILPNIWDKLFIFLTYAPIFLFCFSFNALFCFGRKYMKIIVISLMFRSLNYKKSLFSPLSRNCFRFTFHFPLHVIKSKNLLPTLFILSG